MLIAFYEVDIFISLINFFKLIFKHSGHKVVHNTVGFKSHFKGEKTLLNYLLPFIYIATNNPQAVI